MKRRILSLLLLLGMVLSLAACGAKADVLKTKPLTIEHETRFGGAYLHMTIEDFCALGFKYGDAVDIAFSNGYKVENIPFYDGYYTKAGGALLVAYPGYPYIRAGFNYGEDLYEAGSLTEDCTAVVTLHERAAFLDVQNVMSMVYTNERENYASDEVFANFRPMQAGQLAENRFYRAASPCDDQYNRAAYSGALCEKAGIGYVLDLADSAEELEAYCASDLNSPYWKTLYKNGKVLPLSMSANYRDAAFAESVAEAMRAVLTEDGPFLIHCTEGKDRTGFVCLLVEALAGASAEELERDYMITYDNYYGVTEETDAAGYAAVRELKFGDMLTFLCGTEAFSSLTPEQIAAGAEDYLRFGGMTDEEIGSLSAALR